jgi:MEMO1 family protein
MTRRSTLIIPIAIAVLIQCVCAQQQGSAGDRQPAVAGQFYPGDPNELRSMLKDLFAHAVPSKGIVNLVAIIAPHAGYVFSGGVAASSFNQIDPQLHYENIFILGPSHHVGFEGASVYTEGDFITPLGIVKVNTSLGKELVAKNKVFVSRTDAHRLEHSVEVQLPFLQTRLGKDIRIVPIVVGASSAGTCRQIAEALRPYFGSNNLFVISTDFSHYPAYDDARRADKATADAIVSRSPDNLIDAMRDNAARKIPNLETSLCGWSCVLSLLYLVENNPSAALQIIDYKNSGDAAVGEKERVVGYYAIAVALKGGERKESFNLSDSEKKDLLVLARKTVEQCVGQLAISTPDPSQLTKSLKTNCGAFVTLKKGGDLRGCIGRFDASEPLYKVVQQMAVASSTEDTRFAPVSPKEVSQLEIEISVLTPMRRIKSIDEIQLGKHGIYVRKGPRAGTFLPQVATETGWTKEEFLGHCSRDKAGLGWDGWRDAELYVYEAIVFSEQDLKLR